MSSWYNAIMRLTEIAVFSIYFAKSSVEENDDACVDEINPLVV